MPWPSTSLDSAMLDLNEAVGGLSWALKSLVMHQPTPEMAELDGKHVNPSPTHRQPLSIYVSGVPGTGKTATVRAVVEHLKSAMASTTEVKIVRAGRGRKRKRSSHNEDGSKFDFIAIDCFASSTPTGLFREILEKMDIQPAAAGRLAVQLNQAFNELRRPLGKQRAEMRPLTDDETELLFKKLAKYIGDNIRQLLERDDGNYSFRYHLQRVYYCSEALMKQAACVPRKQLTSLGTCMGKFTKSGKFFLHITALDYLAPYAKWRVWLKPNAEQQFLYGNNIVKSGVGRMTEGCEARQGVVVYNMADMPLGFGITSKSTTDCRRADPTTLVVLHQADLGEYIRDEEGLT